jgi:fucose 4-O-acetylase-like acetyltransferase
MNHTSIQPARVLPALPALLFLEIPSDRPRTRLLEVDAARGLAILLVVVGHVVARDMPEGNAWYADLNDMIYLFHMPLFMVLTGITFALSLPKFAAWAELARFSFQRVERLFVPYVFFGLLIIAGKMAAARVVYVDNPPGSDALIWLILRPNSSGVAFLWFFYVLSTYLLLIPALFQLIGRRPMLLVLLGIALNLLGRWPQYFLLDRAVEYLPFFAAGMVLWIHRAAWARVQARLLWATTLLFGALLVMSIWLVVPKWLAGAASILPVLGWMQRLQGRPQRWLITLGLASMAIYLINTIAIGVTKGLMLKLLPWDGINFLLYFPLLTAAGVAIPMAIRRAAKAYAPRAARYVG